MARRSLRNGRLPCVCGGDPTAQLYEGLLRLRIDPALGDRFLSEITVRRVRQRCTTLLGEAGSGASTLAEAYQLLRDIPNSAVEDELIKKNPRRIKSAGWSVRKSGRVGRGGGLRAGGCRTSMLLRSRVPGDVRQPMVGWPAALRRCHLDAQTVRIEVTAMAYLHAAKNRDRAVADVLGEIVKEGLRSREKEGVRSGEDEHLIEGKIN
ncbi:hypothetical protein [Streptosporangium carneum]|uniref:hypothetical protein n=1 Tax=Streptosporangium carneum TaxID=47481 RepID=UPI0022F2C8E6|nr:hypothetical protein [Streptosporangium carneum]